MRRRGTWTLGGAVILVTVAVTAALSGPIPDTGVDSAPIGFPGSVGDRFDTLADRSYLVKSLERTAVVGPEAAIAVANLSIEPGRYLVSYEFESRLISDRADAELRCGIVDTNGIERFIAQDPHPVTVGPVWQRHVVQARFSLPDVTLGIRCTSERTELVHALFRKVSLSVVSYDAIG